MNIENIAALARQLESLGFDNAGYLLLKKICFKPDSFILSEEIERGTDHLNFILFLEKKDRQNIYALKYYDAVLEKRTPLVDATINGINTTDLDKSMSEIGWKNAFDFTTKKTLNLEDIKGWESEQKIESIIESLSDLEKSDEGKSVASGLKLKYWVNHPYQELFGHIVRSKNKSDVSQRFHFFEGQGGITVDEAYRFLQNSYLERQIQFRKKQDGSIEIAGELSGQLSSSKETIKTGKPEASSGKKKTRLNIKSPKNIIGPLPS